MDACDGLVGAYGAGGGSEFVGGEAVLTQVDDGVYQPQGVGVLCSIGGSVTERKNLL